jgi:putative exosortase-associated protein (TIGR04073 family)
MNTFHRFFVTGLLAGVSLIYTSTALADQMYQQQQYQQQDPQQFQQPTHQRTYGEKVANKATNGAINLVTSPLEIPKSIINDTNAEWSNIFFGLVGGVIEGTINAAGRATVGLSDLVLAPIPTKPIVQPQYVWDDFYETKTAYKDIFRLDDNEKPPKFSPPK